MKICYFQVRPYQGSSPIIRIIFGIIREDIEIRSDKRTLTKAVTVNLDLLKVNNIKVLALNVILNLQLLSKVEFTLTYTIYETNTEI